MSQEGTDACLRPFQNTPFEAPPARSRTVNVWGLERAGVTYLEVCTAMKDIAAQASSD